RVGALMIAASLLGETSAHADLITPITYVHTAETRIVSIDITLPFDRPSGFKFREGCDGDPRVTCWAIRVSLNDLFGPRGVYNDLEVLAVHFVQHDPTEQAGLRAFIGAVTPGMGDARYRATFADYQTHRDWLQLLLVPAAPGVSSQLWIRTDRTELGAFPPILGVVPEPGTLALVGTSLLGWICRRRKH
ncbi:MAG: PEP-CTERM sorting domain-containing protein, partial [Acidimicrobiia bacterium]